MTTLPQQPQKEEPITFSFAAAGWLQMYLFGVGHAIATQVPNARCNSIDIAMPTMTDANRAMLHFCGSSAGSLAAAAILTGADMEQLAEYAATCAVHCRSRWYRAFMIRDYVRNGVELFIAQQPALFRAKAATAASTAGVTVADAAVVKKADVEGTVLTADGGAESPAGKKSPSQQISPPSSKSGLAPIGDPTLSAPSSSLGEEEEEDDDVAALNRSTNSIESLLLASVAAEDADIFNEEVRAMVDASASAGSPTSQVKGGHGHGEVSCDEDVDEDDYDLYDREVAAERERRAMAQIAEVCGAVQGHKSHDYRSPSRRRAAAAAVAGAAAGAATATASGDSNNDTTTTTELSATLIRRRTPRFSRALRLELRQRLEVYATALPRIRALVFSDFRGVRDVEEALVASCCITPLAGLPFRTRRTGDWVCDGGLAAFQPRSGRPNVVSVSALYFTGADISPSEIVPAWWGLYPPGDAEYRDLFDMGYNDALRTLQSKGLVSAAAAEGGMRPRTHKLRARGVTGLVSDTIAAIFYLCFRAFAMFLVYAELAIVASVCLGVTVFHTWFPNAFEALLLTSRSYRRSEGGRFAALKDYFALAMQFANARVLLHLAFGRRLDGAASQLERYSRIYRVAKPLMG